MPLPPPPRRSRAGPAKTRAQTTAAKAPRRTDAAEPEVAGSPRPIRSVRSAEVFSLSNGQRSPALKLDFRKKRRVRTLFVGAGLSAAVLSGVFAAFKLPVAGQERFRRKISLSSSVRKAKARPSEIPPENSGRQSASDKAKAPFPILAERRTLFKTFHIISRKKETQTP